MAVKKAEEATRVLEVHTQSKGTFRVTIPAAWKVTFGAFSPSNGRGYGDTAAALRIYESTDKQRACFRDVVSFFDISLPIQRLVKRESGSREWETSEDGFSSNEKVKVERNWQ